MVAGGKGGEQIVGSRSVQQVGGQLAVPDDAAAPAACGHGSGIEGGGIEYVQRHLGVVQQGDQFLLGEGIHGGNYDAVFYLLILISYHISRYIFDHI